MGIVGTPSHYGGRWQRTITLPQVFTLTAAGPPHLRKNVVNVSIACSRLVTARWPVGRHRLEELNGREFLCRRRDDDEPAPRHGAPVNEHQYRDQRRACRKSSAPTQTVPLSTPSGALPLRCLCPASDGPALQKLATRERRRSCRISSPGALRACRIARHKRAVTLAAYRWIGIVAEVLQRMQHREDHRNGVQTKAVTLTLNVEVTALLDTVPVIFPVLPFSLRPFGSEPFASWPPCRERSHLQQPEWCCRPPSWCPSGQGIVVTTRRAPEDGLT